MRIYNSDSGIGKGVLKPIQIGFLNERNLYITYTTKSFDNSRKEFHYSLLLENE
jgi:hypothetical protein